MNSGVVGATPPSADDELMAGSRERPSRDTFHSGVTGAAAPEPDADDEAIAETTTDTADPDPTSARMEPKI